MHQLNIQEIKKNLKQIQKDFSRINGLLKSRRDDMTDDVVDDIVSAYEYLNEIISKNIQIFEPAGLYCLLELNHIVLCGKDPHKRMQFYEHITETRKRFYKNIGPIMKWYRKKGIKLDAVEQATCFYIASLSQPQLFIEGNHRTENIIFNYILISKNHNPYIIKKESVIDYFNLSSEIKFSKRDNFLNHLKLNSKDNRNFQKFIKENCSKDFLMIE